ncbi:MAG: pyridoxamine 5'-phosphate oxidase [Actinomycetes bacterium]
MNDQPVRDMRIGYANPPLIETLMAATPLQQFSSWFREAVDAHLPEPNAMVLSTADGQGNLTSRTVLMKDIGPAGITFFTNHDSTKGQAIAAHPQVSVVFPWYQLQRQVCISGVAQLINRDEVDEYFATRPRDSQLGAWASAQSTIIKSAEVLQAAFQEAAARFPGNIPTPPHWGGYRIAVSTIEFWSGRPSRLHDRLRYARISEGGLDDAASWVLERLSP